MTLVDLLEQRHDALVEQASRRLEEAALANYQRAGASAGRERIAALLELTRSCIEQRDTGAIVQHGERIGRERFNSGYDLSEVLRAFNLLEEAIWQRITEELPASEHAPAIGLVSTVLGAGKETLAGTYVSLAARGRAPALNFDALFGGT